MTDRIEEILEELVKEICKPTFPGQIKLVEPIIADSRSLLFKEFLLMVGEDEKCDWQGDNYDTAFTNGRNSLRAEIREEIKTRIK